MYRGEQRVIPFNTEAEQDHMNLVVQLGSSALRIIDEVSGNNVYPYIRYGRQPISKNLTVPDMANQENLHQEFTADLDNWGWHFSMIFQSNMELATPLPRQIGFANYLDFRVSHRRSRTVISQMQRAALFEGWLKTDNDDWRSAWSDQPDAVLCLARSSLEYIAQQLSDARKWSKGRRPLRLSKQTATTSQQ